MQHQQVSTSIFPINSLAGLAWLARLGPMFTATRSCINWLMILLMVPLLLPALLLLPKPSNHLRSSGC
jgi:hypothetical protein